MAFKPDIKLTFGVSRGGGGGDDSENIIRSELSEIINNIRGSLPKIRLTDIFDFNDQDKNYLIKQIQDTFKSVKVSVTPAVSSSAVKTQMPDLDPGNGYVPEWQRLFDDADNAAGSFKSMSGSAQSTAESTDKMAASASSATASFKDISAHVVDIENQIANTEGRLASLLSQIDRINGSLDVDASGYDKLETDIDETKEHLSELRKEHARYIAQLKASEEATPKYKTYTSKRGATRVYATDKTSIDDRIAAAEINGLLKAEDHSNFGNSNQWKYGQRDIKKYQEAISNLRSEIAGLISENFNISDFTIVDEQGIERTRMAGEELEDYFGIVKNAQHILLKSEVPGVSDVTKWQTVATLDYKEGSLLSSKDNIFTNDVIVKIAKDLKEIDRLQFELDEKFAKLNEAKRKYAEAAQSDQVVDRVTARAKAYKARSALSETASKEHVASKKETTAIEDETAALAKYKEEYEEVTKTIELYKKKRQELSSQYYNREELTEATRESIFGEKSDTKIGDLISRQHQLENLISESTKRINAQKAASSGAAKDINAQAAATEKLAEAQSDVVSSTSNVVSTNEAAANSGSKVATETKTAVEAIQKLNTQTASVGESQIPILRQEGEAIRTVGSIASEVAAEIVNEVSAGTDASYSNLKSLLGLSADASLQVNKLNYDKLGQGFKITAKYANDAGESVTRVFTAIADTNGNISKIIDQTTHAEINFAQRAKDSEAAEHEAAAAIEAEEKRKQEAIEETNRAFTEQWLGASAPAKSAESSARVLIAGQLKAEQAAEKEAAAAIEAEEKRKQEAIEETNRLITEQIVNLHGSGKSASESASAFKAADFISESEAEREATAIIVAEENRKREEINETNKAWAEQYLGIQQTYKSAQESAKVLWNADKLYDTNAAKNKRLQEQESRRLAKETLEDTVTRYKLLSKLNQTYNNGQDALLKSSAAQFGKSADAYRELEKSLQHLADLRERLGKVDSNDTDARKDVLSSINKENAAILEQISIIKQNGEYRQSLIDKIKLSAKNIASMVSITQVFNTTIRYIRMAVDNVRELDSAFTQLSIVTGASEVEMERFKSTAIEMSKSLGKSVVDITGSIETFSRLGYSLSDAAQLSKYATILSNVASVTNEEATTGLTSIIKGYGMRVDEAEHVSDVLIEVGQKYAVSASELMEAFERSGAALNATGVSFEKSAALIAAANASLQDASVVGTALKTVSARIRGSKTELEELGEDTDGLADGFSKYAAELKKLSGVDIMVDGSTNEFKDLYEIMSDVASVWDRLSDTQRARVSEILGGTRQLQVISSIITNWKDASGALLDAQNAIGVTAEANEKYMSSIEAKIGTFKATWQELSTMLVDSDLIKGIVDTGTTLLKVLEGILKLLSDLGGAKVLFLIPVLTSTIGSLVAGTSKLSPILKKIATRFQFAMGTIGGFKGAALGAKSSLEALGIATSGAAVSIGLWSAGITAAISVISLLIKKQQEKEQATRDAGKTAAEESDAIAQSALSYKKLSSQYDSTGNASDEYINAQRELIKQLGLQKAAVYELVDAYGNLDDALLAASIQKLHGERGDLEAATEQYATDVVRNARSNLKLQYGVSQYGVRLSDDGSGAYEELVKNGYLETEGTLINGAQLGIVSLGNIESIEDAIDAYNTLGNIINELDAEYYNSDIYNQLNNTYKALSDSIGQYGDSVEAYNKNIIQSYLFAQLQGRDLPKTRSEFVQFANELKQGLYVEADSLGIIDADAYVNDLLDDMLSSDPAFKEFYSGEEEISNGASKAAEEIQTLSDVITEYKNKTSLLDTAKKEMLETGEISLDTLNSIMGATDDWADYIDVVNGKMRLNSDAWERLAQSDIDDWYDQQTSALREETDALIEDNKTLDESSERYAENTEKIKENQAALDKYGEIYGAISSNWTGDNPFQQQLDSYADLDAYLTNELSVLSTLNDIQTEVGDSFIVSLEKAMEFAKVYPEILANATVAADGQLQLNEDVVNAFIDGKKAEIEAGNTQKKAELEAEKIGLEAKKAFIESEIEMAKTALQSDSIAEKSKAQMKLQNMKTIVEAMLAVGMAEAEIYDATTQILADDMSASAEIVSTFATILGGSLSAGAAGGADSVHTNSVAMVSSLLAVALQAWEAAKAAASIGTNSPYNPSSVDVPGGGSDVFQESLHSNEAGYGGIADEIANHGDSAGYTHWYNHQIFQPSLHNNSLGYDGVEFGIENNTTEYEGINNLNNSLDDILGGLFSDLAITDAAIAEIDGKLALLDAAGEALDNFSAPGSGSGSGDGSDADEDAETEGWFKRLYEYHQHLLDMEQEDTADYLNWLKTAYKQAYEENEISLEEFWKYEKEIFDAEKELEENAKDSFRELVEYRVDMIKQELEDEKDALDKRLDALKDFYDEQKEMLKDEREEERYIEEQAEKRKSVTDLQAQLEQLSTDDSAWAQRRTLELQAELAEAQKELTDFEKDKALDLATNALDDAYDRQSTAIQAQIDAIDEQLNDPNALFNRALADIKNNTMALYSAMLAYNKQYGDADDDTVKEMWENAYRALEEFKIFSGKDYDGVVLVNATDYKKVDTPYTENSVDWVDKLYDGNGYASGTSSASSGLHRVNERGTEYVFTSSDGNTYRMLNGGDKVLNAKATNFLYNFATSGGAILGDVIKSAVAAGLNLLTHGAVTQNITMSPITINGNADAKTVSELRRAQRESLQDTLKAFNKLNK